MPLAPRLLGWLVPILLLTATLAANSPSEAPTVRSAVSGQSGATFTDWMPEIALQEPIPAPPTTTTTEPAPEPPPTQVVRSEPPRTVPNNSGDVWWQLALCESGGRQDASGGGGLYLSYFQWLLSTWHSVGGPGDPRDHSYDEQLVYAKALQARSGWGQWPGCARRLGLL